MKLIITLLSLILSSNFLISQSVGFHPYNMNFEIGETGRMPYSWELTKKSADNGYIAYSTNKEVSSGNRALLFFNLGENKEELYGTVYQRFDANRYRGKQVRLSASVKTEFENDTSEVRLFINEYNRARRSNQLEIMGNEPIKQTDWKKFETDLFVTKDAYYISIGFTLIGTGNVYIDDVKFEIIESLNYDIIDNFELNDNQINNILNFAKVYSYAKYYQSTSQVQNLNFFNFLRYGISESINSENISQTLSNVFKLITPNLKINNNNNFSPFEAHQDKIENFSILYKHRVLYNDCYPTISQTEIKNLYTPDKSKQGFMMRNLKHLELRNKELVFSAKAKANLVNVYSNAQLWLRVFKRDATEINLYMNENPITSGEWKEYSISQLIPDDVTEIKVGLVLNGDGTVWFDDVKFSVKENGKLVDLVNGLENFEKPKLGTIPSDWTVPYSVSQLGYEFYTDNKTASSGKQSLKITTENTLIIKYPEDNEIVNKQIDENLFINFPISHNLSEVGTLPNVDENELNNLIAYIEGHNLTENDFYSQITTLLEIYINLKHFYIYEDIESKIDEQFKKTITLLSNKKLTLKESLLHFVSFLKDSQLNVWKINDENSYSLPFSISKVNNDYIVKELYQKDSEIQIGEKLLKIDGVSFDELVKKQIELRPGINEKYKTIKAISSILFSNSISTHKLEFENKTIEVKKDKIASDYLNTENFDLAKPNEDILYVNMSMIDDKFFKYVVDEITDIKGIIFDARGVSLLSEHFLGYLLNNDAPTNQSKIPFYVHPDKNRISYETIQPNLKKLNKPLTKNIVFLIDENTIGYTEFVMYLVKYYGLGTLIGRNSVGMAHDVVSIPLPLDYNLSMSVFEINSPNQKKSLSFKMIEPDIYVEESMDLEKDHILEKGIEFLKNKIK